jgi:TonB family protein
MSFLTSQLALLISAASPPAEPTRLGEVSGWALTDLKGACSISTVYEGKVFVHVRFDFGENEAILTVANPAWESVEEDRRYDVQLEFSNGDEWSDTGATGLRIDSKETRLTGLSMTLDGDEFLKAFARSAGLAVTMGDRKLALLSLKGTGIVAARLRECAVQGFKNHPPDPFKGLKASSGAGKGATSAPVLVEPAHAKANLSGLISNDDYPPTALRQRQEGSVRFRLTVGTTGRPEKCEITSSSGYPELDAATCRLISSRARFTPARDSSGNSTSDTYESVIAWRLGG